MTDYVFTTNDERLGTITTEAYVFPKLDVNGQAYDKVNASTKHVGGGRFVVLPLGGDKEEHTYTLEGAAKAQPAKDS